MNDNIMDRTENYVNSASENEQLFAEFTRLTDSITWLKEHRDIIEENQWGCGDRAFHYMWWLLLSDVAQTNPHPACLEIGVFKGQVVSLWAKIGEQLGIDLSITGISPLEGNSSAPAISNLAGRLLKRARCMVDQNYRQAVSVGNLYAREDYRAIVGQAFQRFGLDIADIRLIEGYSNDIEVFKQVQGEKFHVIYIDGDHSFEGSSSDITMYHDLVSPGGYLVMDDAAQLTPGEGYFKGYESVSRACEKIPEMGFVNVINIGHNRVYKKLNDDL